MFPKTRDEWKAILPDESYLKNSGLGHLLKLFPLSIDREWLVFLTRETDLYASKILYLEDDKVAVLGCGYCLFGTQIYNTVENTLKIADRFAIPFSKKSTMLDDFRNIYDKFLFYCPYCEFPITKYSKALFDDELNPSDRQQIIKMFNSEEK